MTVPDDDGALLAALRSRGVRAGQRLHVVVAPDDVVETEERVPEFFASFSGSPDLSSRAEEFLAAEFPSAS
jgi:hypothetical protein